MNQPKTLPVFGPQKSEQNVPLPVFGPVQDVSDGAPVWAQTTLDQPQAVTVFAPSESDTKASTVFVPAAHAELVPVFHPSIDHESIQNPSMVTGAAHEVPKHQGQREIDKIIRKFLKRIKAENIRIRRVGHTTYSWKHELDPEPGDTGSDVRWEIKLTGQQIHMGVYDIKPFYRVVSGPFTVDKLSEIRKNILDEMDRDAEG